MSSWYMDSKRGLLGPIGLLALLEFNSKVDSTFHHDLDAPKCELWNGENFDSLSLSLSKGGRQLPPEGYGNPNP